MIATIALCVVLILVIIFIIFALNSKIESQEEEIRKLSKVITEMTCERFNLKMEIGTLARELKEANEGKEC